MAEKEAQAAEGLPAETIAARTVLPNAASAMDGAEAGKLLPAIVDGPTGPEWGEPLP